MTTSPAADQSSTTADQAAEVRTLLAAADRKLLGETIAITDDDWHAPSALPGWTRGHVATHIARHAEAFTRLANWARTGTEQVMYPTDRDAAIEAGAGRGGLEIQTDLDATAGALAEEFDAVAEAGAWDKIIKLRDGQQINAGLLPHGRLFEVTIHHLDLGVGRTIDDLDPETAAVALGWAARRLSARDGHPRLRLITSTEQAYDLGQRSDGDVITVSGPANLLLGWITRWSGAEGLTGPIPELPTFG